MTIKYAARSVIFALRYLACFAGCCLALGTVAVCAADVALTDRATMQEALRAIPWERLGPEGKATVQGVTNNTTIFRRMPTKVFACDPEMHVYLLRHPDVVVNIWELMGISKVRVDRTGDNSFRAVDGGGTTADVEILFGSPEVHVIYAEGTYTGPLFKNQLQGKCVLVIRSSYQRAADGQIQVTNTLDAFLQLENLGLELVAKTFQPMMGKAADFNFTEVCNFVGRVSQAAEINPQSIQRMSARLGHVKPDVRQEFAEVGMRVGERAATRVAERDAAVRAASAQSRLPVPESYAVPRR